MSQSKKKNKSKKRKTNHNNSSNSQQNSSCKNSNNQSSNKNNTSKLCAFSSVDYIVLASTLAIALREELSAVDINILASFFAVLSDELALIAAVDVCNDNDEETSTFVPPLPDLAVSSSQSRKFIKKKK